MPLARISDKIIFFAHIPKTGGTSVETYLRRKGKMGFHMRGRRGWCKTVPQHIHADLHTRLFSPDFTDLSFCVIREPIARLMSEYRYRLERKDTNASFDRWFSQALEQYETNSYTMDNHIRPQVEFISSNMKVFRFEDGLTAVYDWIDEVTDKKSIARDIWEKKSTVDLPEISKSALEQVHRFYAKDFEYYARLQ